MSNIDLGQAEVKHCTNSCSESMKAMSALKAFSFSLYQFNAESIDTEKNFS